MPEQVRLRYDRLAHSPVDALIDLVVRCRVCGQVPIGFNFDTLAHRCVTTIPKRRPSCRGDARWFCLCPDVIEYFPDVSTERDGAKPRK